MKKFLVWIRRDLRLNDHTALMNAMHMAKKEGVQNQGHVIFIFDQNILDKIKDKEDRRVTFIIQALLELQSDLNKIGANLIVKYGNPITILPELCLQLKITHLFFNRDYEPYAVSRDRTVQNELKKLNVLCQHFKDHVIFERHEILTKTLTPYKMFTPYKNQWTKILHQNQTIVQINNIKENDLKYFFSHYSEGQHSEQELFNLINFKKVQISIPGGRLHAISMLHEFKQKLDDYHKYRDYPSLDGTSQLSPYIRHGIISIREVLCISLGSQNKGSLSFLNEIIWRDFYQMILATFPHVAKESFKREYQNIKWPGKKEHFIKWCQGQTGFPIVDAAMRCLNQTGLMPNRLRMVVASFLCKTLLIDYRWGESYFSDKLLDFDLAANNGGWQWCASTGTDACPYFRIFNPYNQSLKFEKEGLFIKKFCPELRDFSDKLIHRPESANFLEQMSANCIIGEHYPYPIVRYEVQRAKALALYKSV